MAKKKETPAKASRAAKGEPKASRAKAAKTSELFQFRITLVGSNPPIWRRVQVTDCTLDKLHEHIQTAMGWENAHLHQFNIGGECYGDPELLQDEIPCIDSTVTKISKLVPKDRKRLKFQYEYDFGDGWEHEIVFEGCPQAEPGKSYPLCIEGERACPPEDVGGVWGFYAMLEALANPKHERHREFKQWVGKYDPEQFDPAKATKAMIKGLPDWREFDEL
jgi:hypothetical protein